MIDAYNPGHLPEPEPAGRTKFPDLSDAVFLAAIILGILLRLIAVIWGDVGSGDGLGRLGNSVYWAGRPTWQGLSGVWRPLHWYFLGALLRVWDEPVILAKLINFVCGVGTLIVFRKAVRPVFGEVVASLSSLLLSVYWTHIWLTSSYWVEIPYLFLVFLAVRHAIKAVNTNDSMAAFLSGLFLTISIFLRHEGTLILGLFLVWFLMNTKDRVLTLRFALLPVCASIWGVIEPWLYGRSFYEYFSIVTDMKAGENLLQGFSIKDCLYLWVIMPATAPSVFVIIPGLYGLWRARRLIRRDLFAWMFITQAILYFCMTLASAWRPQLRYILLYFVNLLPYAALTWSQLIQRFSVRKVLLPLMAATILTQSSAWWIGRNSYLPMGWLPLEVRTAPQRALDDWLCGARVSSQTDLMFVSFVYGSISESWSLFHSLVLNRLPLTGSAEIYVAETPGIARGELPLSAYSADIVFIDPQSRFYSEIVGTLSERSPSLKIKEIHPRIAVLFLSQQAQTLLGINPC